MLQNISPGERLYEYLGLRTEFPVVRSKLLMIRKEFLEEGVYVVVDVVSDSAYPVYP
jgi:hypothetical protein